MIATSRMRSFETDLYAAFDPSPPPRSMELIETRWRGAEKKDFRNNDEQQIERILNWRPWPEVIGYRLAIDATQIYTYISIPALHYYLPAMMLTGIYLSRASGDFPLGVDEYLYPPFNAEIRQAFSGYGPLRQEYEHDNQKLTRFTEFHKSLGPPQRRTCQEFLRIYFELRWKPDQLEPFKAQYDQLVDYWS